MTTREPSVVWSGGRRYPGGELMCEMGAPMTDHQQAVSELVVGAWQ